MAKSRSIRGWFRGEKGGEHVRVLGQSGTPYLRYDPSHHLEKETYSAKGTRNRGMLRLAIGRIRNGVLPRGHFALRGMRLVLVMLAVAAGVFVLVNR